MDLVEKGEEVEKEEEAVKEAEEVVKEEEAVKAVKEKAGMMVVKVNSFNFRRDKLIGAVQVFVFLAFFPINLSLLRKKGWK